MATLFQQIEREDIGNRMEWNKRQQLHLVNFPNHSLDVAQDL
jgi:hypothetical protein